MEFIEKNIDDESASNRSRNKKTTRKKKSSSQFNSKSVYQFNAPPVLEKLENFMTNGERRSSIIVDEEPPSPMNETSTNRNTTTTTTRRKGNKSCSIKGQMKQMRRQVKEERARNGRMRSYLRRIHVQRRHIIREMRRSKCERVEIECEFAGFREYKMREIRKLTEELEAMHKEYCQVMSERDAMNKDMEALEEKVMKIEQINSQIIQHSQSNNSSYIADQIDSIAKYISRDVDLSDNQKVNANRPKYDQLEHINEQTDITDNNIEESLDEASLRQQLLECRKKRDQAILERDRALCERESIRCLCNEMRTQRDKTISELAECIRDFDELKKLRISDLKQIEYLEEKLYECEQKLIPLEQKHRDETELEHHDDEDNHVEHDSFEKDGSLNFKQNEKTLKIDFDLDDDQIDDDLGIEFVFKPAKITHSKFDPNAVVNREDSQENSAGERGRGKVDELGQIFVSKVCKESVVFGKLKEYDQILKVNDNDVQFVSVLEFDELINNLNRSNQFVVRREYIHSEPTVNGNNVLIESSKCSMASDISYLEYLRKYQNGANSQQFDSDEDEEEEDNEEEEEIDEEELEDEEEKHENESTTSEEKNVPALEHSPSFIINNSSDNSINTASSRSDNTTNHKTTNISNNKTKKTNHQKDFKHLKIYNKKTLNSKKYH